MKDNRRKIGLGKIAVCVVIILVVAFRDTNPKPLEVPLQSHSEKVKPTQGDDKQKGTNTLWLVIGLSVCAWICYCKSSSRDALNKAKSSPSVDPNNNVTGKKLNKIVNHWVKQTKLNTINKLGNRWIPGLTKIVDMYARGKHPILEVSYMKLRKYNHMRRVCFISEKEHMEERMRYTKVFDSLKIWKGKGKEAWEQMEKMEKSCKEMKSRKENEEHNEEHNEEYRGARLKRMKAKEKLYEFTNESYVDLRYLLWIN